MGSKDDAPTWADQWGSGDDNGASAGAGKADGDKKTVAGNVKAAALVGAHKVKSGTSSGIKWVKEQYQKRASSK